MKRICILAVFLAAAGIVYAENTALTEQAVVDAALKNNPALIAAQKQAEAADAASHRSYWLPDPMIGMEYMGVDAKGMNLDGAMIKKLDISQAIPFPIKFFYGAAAAHDSSDMAARQYEMKKQETEKEAREAYYSLYRTTKDAAITSEITGLLKQVSKIAASRAATTQDSAKADLEYAKLQNDLITIEQQKAIDAARIKMLTNGDPFAAAGEITIADPEIPELKLSETQVKDAALKNSARIRAAAAGRAMAANMRNMSIAEYIPDLNVTFKKQVAPALNNYEIMFEIEVPLWFFANRQSEIGRAGSESDAAEKNLENEENNVLYEAKEHYETIKADYRTMQLYKDVLIPQAEAAFKSAVASYQTKKIEFMALIDSERMALEMKMDYYTHMTEYLMHYRMLEELTGKLPITND